MMGRTLRVAFTERAKLLELTEPVKQAYAKEIEADQVLARINAIR